MTSQGRNEARHGAHGGKNTTQRRIELGVDLGGAAAWLGLRIALRLGVGVFGDVEGAI